MIKIKNKIPFLTDKIMKIKINKNKRLKFFRKTSLN